MAQKKPKPPPDELQLGAPFAPRDPLGPLLSLPASGIPTKTGATPKGQAQIKLKAKANLKAKADEKKAEKRIISSRQDAGLQRVISGRVAAKAGLAPTSSPFAGSAGGKGSGARTPVESELSANTQLAKRRLQLLKSGGLELPEADRKKEQQAIRKVGSSTALTFADTHQMPWNLIRPNVHQTPAEEKRLLQSAMGQPVAASGKLLSDVKPEPRTGVFMSDYGPGTYGQGHPGVRNLGLPLVWRAMDARANVGFVNTALHKLVGATPGEVPKDVPMMPMWLREIFSPAQAEAAQKSGLTLKEFVSDEEKYGKFALGVTARKALGQLAIQNGWYAQDIPKLTDQELAAEAFNPYKHTPQRFAQNAVTGGAGVLTSLPVAMEQAAISVIDDVRQRSLRPSLRYGAEIGQTTLNHLPYFADRPFQEVAYEDPVGTAATLMPFAKFASLRAGKLAGLEPTRMQPVPTAMRANAARRLEGEHIDVPSETRQTSASVHPIYRAGQAIHDAILRRATLPETRPAGVRSFSQAVGAVGHHLEGRLIKQTRHDLLHQAQLQAGHESHVALSNYGRALRDLPWLRDRAGKPLESAANADARAAVFQGLLGKTPEQIVTYYTKMADRSDIHAEAAAAKAKVHEQNAAQLKTQPSTGVHETAIMEEEAAQGHWQREAEKAAKEAENQRGLASWVADNPFDRLEAGPEATRFLEAAREVARVQDELRQKGGKFDEKGTLWGRLQHNITITLHTEGPGSKVAIEQGHGQTGTPLYREALRIADPLEGLRFENNRARDRLYDNPQGTEGSNFPTPASHDAGAGVHVNPSLRSPVAEHQLGRYNRLLQFQRLYDAIARQREQRKEQRRQRAEGAIASGNQTPVLSVAEEHARAWGIEPSALGQLRAAASDLQDSLIHGGEQKAQRFEQQSADQLQREQAGATNTIVAQIRQVDRELQTMQMRGRPIDEIAKKEREKQQLSEQLQALQPSRKALQGLSQAEKTRLFHGLRQVPDELLDKLIAERLTPDQIQQMTPELLRDLLREELDASPHIHGLYEDIGRRLEDASTRYGEATGGLDPELAAEYQRHSQHYRQRLRAYDQLLEDAGVPTGHLHLQHPDELPGLPPVRQTTGAQFQAGNFGRDMHLFLASDLTALDARAVQGQLIELLADTPWVNAEPPLGAEPPPGMIAVAHDDWQNMQNASPNGEQMDAMFHAWEHPSSAEPVEGKQVWLSRELAKTIQDNAKRGDYKPGPWLRAANTYRRWMLYMLPRTYVNNAISNPVAAVIMGARGRDYREAINILRKHPERVMGTLQGRGPLTNALSVDAAKWHGFQAFWRHHNTFQEDNANVMLYLHHARKQFRKDNNLRWFNRVAQNNELWTDFLERAARGENPQAIEWGKKSAQAFGNMRDSWKADKYLAGSFMFHRWVAHTIYMTLWSLPVHYPGRYAFLVNVSELGHEYEKQHGVWPEWAKGMIPFLHTSEKVPGGIQHMLWGVSTQGVNFFATPGQALDLGTDAQTKYPGQSILSSSLSPLVRVPVEWAIGHRLDTLQPFKDQYGDPLGPFDVGHGIQSVIANTPGINTVTSRAGLSDESIQVPFLGMSHPRYSSVAKFDPNLGPPTPFGHGFWADALIVAAKAFGASASPLDTEGPRSMRKERTSAIYQKTQANIRQGHQNQAIVRMLRGMSRAQRKEWYRKNRPAAYARGDWADPRWGN